MSRRITCTFIHVNLSLEKPTLRIEVCTLVPEYDFIVLIFCIKLLGFFLSLISSSCFFFFFFFFVELNMKVSSAQEP